MAEPPVRVDAFGDMGASLELALVEVGTDDRRRVPHEKQGAENEDTVEECFEVHEKLHR